MKYVICSVQRKLDWSNTVSYRGYAIILLIFMWCTCQAYNYHGVSYFFDGIKGWIACLDPFPPVIHTNDGWKTWEAQPTGTTNKMWDVFFLNDTLGWICGLLGEIRHTSDGGKTWTQQTSGTNKYFTRLYFVDEKHGWVAGGDGKVCRMKIEKVEGTNRDTVIWEEFELPISHTDVYGIFFIDTLWGWIATRTVAEDTVGECNDTSCIFHTRNGGRYWVPQVIHGDTLIDFLDIYFADANEGWVVGGYRHTYRPLIWHSTTSGTRWVEQATPTGSWYLRSLDFIDNKVGWAVGKYGTILHTRDGGNIWELQPTGVSVTLFDIDFIDSLRGIAVGDSSTILITHDGGKDWFGCRLIFPDRGEKLPYRSTQPIRFSIVGKKVKSCRLLYSTDGGNNYSDTIAKDISPDSTMWNWTLPLIISDSCKVKIQILDDFNVIMTEDKSKKDFAILPHVMLPDTVANGGDTLELAVYSTDITGLNVTSCVIGIKFDSSFVKAGSAKKGTIIPENWSFTSTPYARRIKIEIRGDTPLSGSGSLAIIPFIVDPTVPVGDSTIIRFVSDETKFNDGNIPIHLKDGTLKTGVGIEEITSCKIPSTSFVTQNYPNPFTISTEIKYGIPKATHVRITIYNLLGQKIVSLVNENKSAGHYKVYWDGRDASGKEVTGGLYFYKFEAGDKSSRTMKLTLLK